MDRKGRYAYDWTVKVTWFFRLTLIYFAAAIVCVLVTRGTDIAIVDHLKDPAIYLRDTLATFSIGIVVAAAALVAAIGKQKALERLPEIITGLVAVVVMQAGFTLIKTSMPAITPFFADHLFADLDRVLHGGVDPWVFTHWFDLHPALVDLGVTTYITVWLLPALTFPALLAASDADVARKNRFLLLYAFCWIGLGNIVAFAGLSAGPVYYDRLYNSTEFAGLASAVVTSGLSASWIGDIQSDL